MKREEEMSVSFSVREEEEVEEAEAEEEARGSRGAKRWWSSEKRWDGDGGRYGYGLNFSFFPTKWIRHDDFFFRPSKSDTTDWKDVPFLSFEELYTTYATTYTIHNNGGGGVWRSSI